MIGLRTPLVAVLVTLGLALPVTVHAAKPSKKKAEPAAPAPEPARPTPVTAPAVAPAPATGPAATTPLPAEDGAPQEEYNASPFGTDSRTAPIVDQDEDETANFQGLFVKLGLGYGSVSGTDGPTIPEVTCTNCSSIPGLAIFRASAPDRYAQAVTTNKGSGMAAGLEIGYNILGYGSIAADLAWQGSPFGSSTDNAGVGLGGGTIGFHPLRFVKKGKFPLDVRLYGGFTYGISYYYENAMQVDAKGKAWTGTAPLYGLTAEYMFKRRGIFALGFDVRNVMPGYTKWYYNYDNDQTSKLDSPQNTSNWVFKLMLCWHFSGV